MGIETVIEIFVGLAVLGVIYRYWPKSKGLDVNGDGKVDLKDAVAGAEGVVAKVVEEAKVIEAKAEQEIKVEVAKVVEEAKAVEAKVEEVVVAEVKKAATKAKAAVKKAADVNKDGKVDAADVKAAAKKVTAKVARPKKTKT